MQNVQPEIRIHVFHTGCVCVSPGLPFKDAEKNPNPVQLTLLSSYGRKQRLWLPVSAYLIEHPQGKILVDTGWHREIVLLTHLHSDHASGLRQLKEAKHILVSGCNGFMI
jgi:glyoxylase-like metal-dependent hydrolase (beta-lactamase superfamily II)